MPDEDAAPKVRPIHVEVAYALPDRQAIVPVAVPPGTTALEAVRFSHIEDLFPGLDVSDAKLGVFSRPVSQHYVVEEGDRIEIYRPLIADPKEVRRQRAAEGKPMGKKRVRRPDDESR